VSELGLEIGSSSAAAGRAASQCLADNRTFASIERDINHCGDGENALRGKMAMASTFIFKYIGFLLPKARCEV